MDKLQKEPRLRWLADTIMLSRHKQSLKNLAEEAGVSEKTIRRDIEFLTDERNAPFFIFNGDVEKDRAAPQTVELQGFWLKRQEIESLFALNQLIAQLSPGILQQQIKPFQSMIQKLLETENPNNALNHKIKLIEIAERTIQNDVFQTIVQALAQNKQLTLQFWNRESDTQIERTISPQQLIRYKDNWKLDAWCHLRNALRTFSLEAIQTIEIQNKASHIIEPTQLKQHFEASYGIFAGKATKKAVLKFSPYITRWVQFEQWHPNQKSQLNKDGSYQLTIPYHKDQELIQDILKYGADVQVIAPLELKQNVQKTLQKALEQYIKN